MMLLANSVVIFEAAEPLAWKRALEPNSWPFGDLWSAFPEFANSIVLWRRPYLFSMTYHMMSLCMQQRTGNGMLVVIWEPKQGPRRRAPARR